MASSKTRDGSLIGDVLIEEVFGRGPNAARTAVWVEEPPASTDGNGANAASGGGGGGKRRLPAALAGIMEAPSSIRVLKSARGSGSLGSLVRTLRGAFLPEGYPESVTDDYLAFQTWDTLQGLSTYIRSMLSTQVLLAGLGVGRASASAISATFQWFVRDFTGMLGGILFAMYKGSNLDSNAKQWRLAADVINDVGMLLDLLSPLVPSAFLPLLCLGSISRAITGTASGATRAALTQHFAKRQNAADISAKEGSQETAATMVGMLVGMLVGGMVADSVLLLWAAFLLLTAFHVYANYRAVRSLCLTSLNRERAALLLLAYRGEGKQVLSPPVVSNQERLIPSLPQFFSHHMQQHGSRCIHGRPHTLMSPQAHRLMAHIHLGTRLSDLHAKKLDLSVRQALRRYAKGRYLLVLTPSKATVLQSQSPPPSSTPLPLLPHVYAIIHRGASHADVLRAYIHALITLQEIPCEARNTGGSDAGSAGSVGSGRLSVEEVAEARAAAWMASEYPRFLDELSAAHWAISVVQLSPGEWRADWPQTAME
ncbi:hypothetical protein CLOM_g6189 [Closterium sp. NIES-68]|nr:hypothetical protein CLOM_g6189 [Closterium sp. NIES-68]GJP82623.1 hypothetical protein CLOP_g12860 [Closterium sp. NIES-67]